MSASAAIGQIVVIGSINMDLVCKLPSLPRPGETILGSEFSNVPGGKGANQAVAAARLTRERRIHLVGRVGDDAYGQTLLRGLADNGVQIDHVTTTTGVSSGIALVMVEQTGQNSIVVIPGANYQLSPEDIDRADDLLAHAGVVVVQLEVPLETIEYAMTRCHAHGVKIILDPAPAPLNGLPKSLFDVDVITPNQSEAAGILGVANMNVQSIGEKLLARGSRQVVLKLGSDGAMIFGEGNAGQMIPPFNVKVIDTTAAGDAFTGAMAVALTEGKQLPDAVRFANAAGALCCTAFGAQPALPTRAAVERLFATTS